MVALSLALAALTLAMGIGGRRLSSVEHQWPAVRERLVTQASQQLETELRQALHRADAAAAKALEAAKGDRAAAFNSLAQSTNSAGPELGLAILESTGTPWAWAGHTGRCPTPRAIRSRFEPMDITSCWRRAATRPKAGWRWRAP